MADAAIANATISDTSIPLGILPETLLTIEIVLVVFTSIVIITRIAANFKHSGSFRADDYVAVFGLILIAALSAIYYYMTKLMSGRLILLHYNMTFWRLATSSYFIGPFSLYFAKAPLLVLFIQLFGIKNWVRYTSYATLAIAFIIFMVLSSFAASQCAATSNDINEEFITTCLGVAYAVNIGEAVVSLLMDIVIFCIPIPIIIALQLPYYKKIGISLVFCWGILAIVASALSLHFKWKSSNNISSAAMMGMICTVVDCVMALTAGCAPAVYSLWFKHLAHMSLYSKIKTKLISVSRVWSSIPSKSSLYGGPTQIEISSTQQVTDLENGGSSSL